MILNEKQQRELLEKISLELLQVIAKNLEKTSAAQGTTILLNSLSAVFFTSFIEFFKNDMDQMMNVTEQFSKGLSIILNNTENFIKKPVDINKKNIIN